MILAILQARTSSTRLPGKVLKPILGVPMLLRQIERIKHSRLIDRLVVATSTDLTDDPIEQLCLHNDIACFRGDLDDVLDRFYQAAKPFQPDHMVRLTGDCPLADPQLIDKVIETHIKGVFDYTSDALEPTYPDGLDAEVFRFLCLEQAWREAELPSHREHVTAFIYQQPDRFRIGVVKNDIDLSQLRWTVDELVDFELVTRVYEALYPSNPTFSTKDILEFLELNPDLRTINTHYQRNEGLKKSVDKDLIFIQEDKRR
ncbi:MAG: cytidylyltransferase domain-containing protein [Candidatus Aquicultor sp.]